MAAVGHRFFGWSLSSVSQVSKPRKRISSRSGKRRRGDPRATRTVTRAAPKEPTIPRVDRARVAIILLKAAVKKRDWSKVSAAIWLLDSLKSHFGREIDRYWDVKIYLGAGIEPDEAGKSHLDEKLRTKNDT